MSHNSRIEILSYILPIAIALLVVSIITQFPFYITIPLFFVYLFFAGAVAKTIATFLVWLSERGEK